jgi:hypothetical protein
MTAKTPRTRRQRADKHQPPDDLQIEDDDSPEALVISALMDCLPIKRRRLLIASKIFQALERGDVPFVRFEYP